MLPILVVLTTDQRESINQNLFKLSRGDPQALEQIYHICGGRLLSVAMGLTRNLELAKDALQEALVKAVRHINTFGGGNGYAWLCAIVRNCALTALKVQNRHKGADIDEFFHLSDGSDVSQQASVRASVNVALKQLTAKQRMAIWLKYYNEMTVREIAAEMQLPRSSVFELIKRAEQTLKTLLSDE